MKGLVFLEVGVVAVHVDEGGGGGVAAYGSGICCWTVHEMVFVIDEGLGLERDLNLGVSITFWRQTLWSHLRLLGIFQCAAFTGDFKP